MIHIKRITNCFGYLPDTHVIISYPFTVIQLFSPYKPVVLQITYKYSIRKFITCSKYSAMLYLKRPIKFWQVKAWLFCQLSSSTCLEISLKVNCYWFLSSQWHEISSLNLKSRHTKTTKTKNWYKQHSFKVYKQHLVYSKIVIKNNWHQGIETEGLAFRS